MATQEFSNWVGGAPTPVEGDGRLEVLDPASGALLGHTPLSGPADVERAVRAAQAGLRGLAR